MTQTPIDFHKGFHDVDATGAGSAFEAYLTNIHTMPAWVESRRTRYELAALKPGEHVLDAGCGVGMDLAELSAAIGPSGAIVGFDLSAELITRAKERAATLATPVSFEQGDLHTLPFADASFDVVWCERVLMYLERPLDAVREVLRVLKPGGRFVAGEIDFGAIWSTSPDESFRATVQQRTMISVANPLLARQLPGLCFQAGFAGVKVEPTMTLSRDFTNIERASNVAWHLDRMVDEGAATRAEADDYLIAMRRISAAGQFVSMLLVPNLVAIKT